MKQLSPSPEAVAAILRVPLETVRAQLATRATQAATCRRYISGPLWTTATLGRKR
jgi:hypothetical protein